VDFDEAPQLVRCFVVENAIKPSGKPFALPEEKEGAANNSQGTVLRAHTVGSSPGSLSLCARRALSSWERERDRGPQSAVGAARRRSTTSLTTNRHSMTGNLVFSGVTLLWLYSGFHSAARTF